MLFCIADNGPGIPETAQREIIESWKNPFRNTSRSGGLGLALSKKYTQAFGGELTFITSEGQGTSFYLKIPLAVTVAALSQANYIISQTCCLYSDSRG